jgi:hypothetical protein
VREVIDLQRRIFERQRELIESSEAHQTPGFAEYRREYCEAVSDYEEESGFGALCDAISRARVAFVADYHTLRLAQKTFVKIIHGVMHQVDSLCLALEFVGAEEQLHLDRFLRGEIAERTFLRLIRYRENWPYDIWPNFAPIFELAAEQGMPAVAIDSDSELPLPVRDEIAAERIAEAAEDYPDAVILAYTGQMHVAPAHLPAAVEREFVARGMKAPRRVVVYQNAEEIYWQLAAEGREEVEVVRVGPDAYCVNNTPPLVQQLSYLHWIHYDEELIEYTELESTVRSLIRDLIRYFGFEQVRAAREVRVMMVADLDLMDVLEDSDFDEVEKRDFIRQVEAEQSAYLPELNTIYLATLSVNHAAEEAAHFVKQQLSRGRQPSEPADLFYYIALNEACAFFGSKLINPKRKADHQGRLRSTVARARKRGEWAAEERAARFALGHMYWERRRHATEEGPGHGEDLIDKEVFNAAAHLLGYALGDRMFYALTVGLISKSQIRDLFLDPLDEPGRASEVYLDLSDRLEKVRIPRRI